LGPIQNCGLPDVRKAIWTLATRPPDLAIAAGPDENVAKVHVELVMPLFLQLVSKQADVGPAIKLWSFLLWRTVSAFAHATYMPCRSAADHQHACGHHSKACAFDKSKLLKLACQGSKHVEQTVTCVLPYSFRALL